MPDEDPAEQLLAASSNERAGLISAWQTDESVADRLAESAQARLASSPESAIMLAETAAVLDRTASRLASAARATRIQAQALRLLSRHEDALGAMERAAADAVKAGDPVLAARVRLGAIDSLGWLSRTSEALALASSLAETFRASGEHADAARALVNAANLLWRQDDYAEALLAYESAESALVEVGDEVAVARVEANRANCLTMLDRVDEAQLLLERAREAFLRAGMYHEAAMVEGNTGTLHFICGRYPAALRSHQEARLHFERAGRQVEAAQADLSAADVYRALNLDPEAGERYESAAEIFRRHSIPYELAKCLLGLTWVRGKRQAVEGLRLLHEVERLFRQQGNQVQQAHARLVRAQLLEAAGQGAEALRAARYAARVFRVKGLLGWNLEARFLDASRKLRENPARVSSMQRLAASARRIGRGLLESRAQRELGIAARQTGRLNEAIRRLRRGMAVLEEARSHIPPEDLHTAFLRDKFAVYSDLVSALLERGNPRDLSEALLVVERCKSRLLLERIESALERHPETGEAATPAVQARLETLRAALSRSYQALNAGPGEARRACFRTPDIVEVELLERQYAEALREAELGAQPNLRRDLAAPPKVRRLRSLLQDDECLIEYFMTESSVHAFVLTRFGLRVVSPVAGRREVEDAARGLRFQMHRATGLASVRPEHLERLSGAAYQALGILHRLLVAPLTPASLPGRWVIVPHGVLHGLPFHAFCETSIPLLDCVTISYAPSAAAWAAVRRRDRVVHSETAGQRAIVMAVPSGGLRQVISEAKRIAPTIGTGQVLCGKEATLETFRKKAPGAEKIHLATHAAFRSDNPLFSGICLSDGWLLARDLYEIRLDCKLVTLSACHTGVSEPAPGDELFGLCRGFLAAGARNMAVSLWAADDRSTEKMMVRFYKQQALGSSVAEALRLAQQAIRKRASHPYFWAPFVLVGAG